MGSGNDKRGIKSGLGSQKRPPEGGGTMSPWRTKERRREIATEESHRYEEWEPRESRKAEGERGFLQAHSEAGGKQGLRGLLCGLDWDNGA